MRLLNTSTLNLEEFSDDRKLPRYAILSHTWEEGQEVLFSDIGTKAAKEKTGYKKLEYSCRQAQADRLGYIWIDACCIDKSSSAELSEAINSMFHWYEKAEICYAHLADFPSKVPSLTDSKWFTRGWTLQELIAPYNVVFYSNDWEELGTKLNLAEDITKRTKIDADVLSGDRDIANLSVARIMSWASDRETTRIEDEAYCLMGLFNVHMPMLYGEGSRAFIRLQEEIMKYSDDHSLFAWRDPSSRWESAYGLLARSPKYFKFSSEIVPYYTRDQQNENQSFSVGNRGLCVYLWLRQDPGQENYIAVLECTSPSSLDSFAGIFLKKLSGGSHQFVRVKADTICETDSSKYGPKKAIYVPQSADYAELQVRLFSLRTFEWRPSKYEEDSGYRATAFRGFLLMTTQTELSKVLPLTKRQGLFTKPKLTFKISRTPGHLAGAILFKKDGECPIVVLLGSGSEERPGFDAVRVADLDDWKILQNRFRPFYERRLFPLVVGNSQVDVTFRRKVVEGIAIFEIEITIKS